MRIAIAGATGLVGHGVASALRLAGHDVVTVGRRKECDVRLDLIRAVAPPASAFAGCEALVHAAGVIDEDFADARSARAKAEAGATVLTEAAIAGGVRRLVYFSSAHVYGPLQGDIDESHPVDPRSDYARAHLATESRMRNAAGRAGASLLVARPCAVFGPLAEPGTFSRWSLIPFDFPRQAAHGRIVLKSPGNQRRNFVSSPGLGAFTRDWLESAGEATVANVPGTDELSVYDFALLCARIAGEESGRECSVERPAGGGGTAPPLRYLSRHGTVANARHLEEHVREIIRAFLEKATN